MTLTLLVLAIAIALEPLPLTAFIIVLASHNGLRKGWAFIVGWTLSLAAVVLLTVALTGNSPPRPNTAPSTAALWVKIVIGLVLLVIAARQRAKLSRPKVPKPPPKWQQQIDEASPLYVAGLAFLLQPWGLIAAGAATIVDAHIGSWSDVLPLIMFALVATSSYLTIALFATRRPDATAARLERLRTWFDSHTDVLIAWLAFVVGVYLVVDSAYLLLT
jgi:threonine/homoserine/homoserine lactone efflux protein